MIVVGQAQRLPFANGCVDTVVTSPPYFGLRDYGVPGEVGAEPTPDEYVAAMRAVLAELVRVLRPDGNVFVVVGDKYARTGGVDRKPRGNGADPGGRVHLRPVQRGVEGVPDGSLIGLPSSIALAAIEDGWLWRQEIVWRKPNPLPESVRRRCVRAHETVLHLTRSAQHYAAPAARGGALGHDVWDVAVQGYRDPEGVRHPAVFPEALVRRCLEGWCPSGGFVLDPFAGSGTTLAVARSLGMRAAGVDLSPSFAAVAARRLEAS